MISTKAIKLKLGAITPKWIVAPFYRLSFFLLQKSVAICFKHDTENQLWIRHSFTGSHWRPFSSDIDLTLWTSLPPHSPVLQNWLGIYKKLKFFFPVLGELNIYWNNGEFANWMNPYELKKDPALQAKIKPIVATKEHLMVFILKTLESNSEELFGDRRLFVLRSDKWHYFNSLVGQDCPINSLPEYYLHLISKYSDEKLNSKDLRNYFSILAQSQPPTLLSAVIKTSFFNKFCAHQEVSTFSDTETLKLIGAVLQWEVWGLSTQLPFAFSNSKSIHQFVDHLSNLAKETSTLPKFPNQTQIIQAIEKIKVYLLADQSVTQSGHGNRL